MTPAALRPETFGLDALQYGKGLGRTLADNALHCSRQGFGRGANRTNNQQQKTGNSPQSSPQTPYPPANMLHSPSLSSSLSVDTLSDSEGTKYFFQEKYASLNVKGNFLTLCACPKNVELGEWLAHQGTASGLLRWGVLSN